MHIFTTPAEFEEAMQRPLELPETIQVFMPRERLGIVSATLSALEFHVESEAGSSGGGTIKATLRRKSRNLLEDLEAENKQLKAEIKALVESQAACACLTQRDDLASVHTEVASDNQNPVKATETAL